MSSECNHKNCFPDETGCILGNPNYTQCKHWKILNLKEEVKGEDTEQKNEIIEKLTETPVSWTGNSFGLIDIGIVAERSNIKTIGFIGPHNAGKTSLLAMIYTLLLRGELKLENDYSFCGSYTLLGWEQIAQYYRYINRADRPCFPPHTTSSVGRIGGLLHLAFKKNNLFKDILFTDAPGEWFNWWAIKEHSEKTRGARWIHESADAFVFFIDCDGLLGAERGELKENTLHIARRLRENIDNRPTAILWAKADKIEGIDKNIKTLIGEELKSLFRNYQEFEVSVLPQSTSDPFCYKNIATFLRWIINEWDNEKGITIKPTNLHCQNFFLNLRDRYYEYE